ncbi:bifunctional N-acetylglucosamine-1-phosphate uridyltransferase/glucosamine-1-phosphate acetyltransferase [Aerococcus urinaehominis]|uniref:Bifunctional protein GlmU n=1 Tax=Aerococcus urinaehominis TaxID=128944 RepID=A0A0X8FKV1_9LACT|nr:bifunctional UDP-N-acetylglucosamine diphosphorylase/glucosamine-1-phosphate N-acetyltransferase GlmU [Aerococcus urinaehominis]AMB99178.1 bifunctional N-acetylglucosamine-1-phosphate uridyltransferase/glucosamine-1-phosphate acetyltransferase [Aerococcus urinaehominis]SDM06446.1 bifunctional UDP-N-acetylglucosamine pyrophosphorylase / Glucosamine-1-phosphate N-acetyltransferase [Aerococcus urinaehominis]
MGKSYAIILAAGKGTRMKSKLYKVLHPVAGKPMVDHVLAAVSAAGFDEIITIVGHGADQVKAALGDRSAYCLQAEQLGTGHAVLQAEELLGDKEGTTLVISGDTPLFTSQTLKDLVDLHQKEGAKATLLTAHADNPFGYGRVIRSSDGSVLKVVEQKDANEAEQAVQEVNTATYVFDNQALFQALGQVGNDNAQGEYYLPDVIGILQDQGDKVAAYQMPDLAEAMGVNDRVALAEANQVYYRRNNDFHMRNGVTIVDPASVFIEAGVEIGADTVIEPNVQLRGKTIIGEDCHIDSRTIITDSTIGNRVEISSSDIESAKVADDVTIGPNAHLRPGADLRAGVHIGNYVEVKNAIIGEGSKAGHLTYIGDAEIGKHVNVACGVIFANYDGVNKHKSYVGDDVFIGSDVTIISPVKVGDRAFIAAGSTISKDIPEDAMGIARQRQENKENYRKKLPISKK